MRRAGDYPGLRDIAETLRGDDAVLQAIERNTRTASRDIRAVRGYLAALVLVVVLGFAGLIVGGL
jgi:hypothetical protein